MSEQQEVDAMTEEHAALVAERDLWRGRAEERRIAHRDLLVERDRYRAALEQIAGTVTLGGMSARIVDELILIAHRALNPPAAEPSYPEREQ